jgi:two-component system response regulator YesN
MLTKPRLAIADDSEALRVLLRVEAELDGRFTVIEREAENGREAVELVHEESPDALILDLSMPLMSGFDVLEELRDENRKSVIVVYSALTSGPPERRAICAGADAFFSKGIPMSEILDRVYEILVDKKDFPPIEKPPIPEFS